MWLGAVLVLNMTWQEKTNIRLCRINAQTIRFIHNKNDGKSIKEVCKWALDAHELDIDDDLFEECYEYLKFCKAL